MSKKLPSHLEEIRSKVFVEKANVKHASNLTHPNAFIGMGIDNEFDFESFKSSFKINIIEIDEKENSMIFDVIGIDVSIANALRRILISEIPTIAIEYVTILQNTGILQDEVLAHRLGLIPIKLDPRLLLDVDTNHNYLDPSNTLIFKLYMKCTEKSKEELINLYGQDIMNKIDYLDNNIKYNNSTVYSHNIEWIPQRGQLDKFNIDSNNNNHKIIDDNIIITKLRPGQTIEVSMKAIKGIGKEHAKWSPVGTAYYKLLPEIEIINENSWNNNDRLELKNICPMNVFDIEDTHIKVSRPRNCTMCKACISNKDWDKKIKLRRIKNHFIFYIESIGQYHVKDLFSVAIKTLYQKCGHLLSGIDDLKTRDTGEDIMLDH